MAINRSSFIQSNGYQPDEFAELFELSPSQLTQAQRYKLLQMKANKSTTETQEFNTLKVSLQNHLISAERFNHFQDALHSMQVYIVENVFDHVDAMKQDTKDYVDLKKTEIGSTVADFNQHVASEKAVITTYINNKKVEITNYVDSKLENVQLTATEAIATMENKKNLFTQFVNIKQIEIQQMVQDFDSRTARYYQEWLAQTTGQVEFNIFNGLITSIPPEAKMDMGEKDVDVIIQGTILRPKVDYEILNNGLSNIIKLKANAQSLITVGTEVSAKWYKNVGKLYFSHASTHELGGSDEIINIQELQLHDDLRSKIGTSGNTVSTLRPATGMWYKVL